MSRFYLGSSASTTTASPLNSTTTSIRDPSSDDEEDNLPYPTPLPRNDFLSPSFSPQAYLSTLHNRHQTLEDLRSHLRNRSQLINKELLDLVNSNYEDFVNLGADLRGGEEKVEGVRVGVLALQRVVESVRANVSERLEEIKVLLEERKRARKSIALGRALLEVNGRIEELEERLVVESIGKSGVDDEEDTGSEDDSDTGEGGVVLNGISAIPVSRLRRHAQQYLSIQQLMQHIGPQNVFLMAQQSRMIKIRNTMLLDLGTAFKQAKAAGQAGGDRLLKIAGIYRDLGELGEAMRALKGG
ncbi:hypothetical protein LTR66_008909 [Elasticomyces elasticus]|nr:hypothetical protein LTR66_008909 [Elasticomyces elasticus]KAK4991696.1 hypothetical protein LTR50_001704 [Elasticomyces elasticus]